MIGLDETRNTDDSTSVTIANDKSNTSNSSKKDKAQTEEANKFEETDNQPSQKKSSDSADVGTSSSDGLNSPKTHESPDVNESDTKNQNGDDSNSSEKDEAQTDEAKNIEETDHQPPQEKSSKSDDGRTSSSNGSDSSETHGHGATIVTEDVAQNQNITGNVEGVMNPLKRKPVPTTNDADKEVEDDSDDEIFRYIKKIKKEEKAKFNAEINSKLIAQKVEHKKYIKEMEFGYEKVIQEYNEKIKTKDQTIADLEAKLASKHCLCYECGKDVDSLSFCSKECKETHIG